MNNGIGRPYGTKARPVMIGTRASSTEAPKKRIPEPRSERVGQPAWHAFQAAELAQGPGFTRACLGQHIFFDEDLPVEGHRESVTQIVDRVVHGALACSECPIKRACEQLRLEDVRRGTPPSGMQAGVYHNSESKTRQAMVRAKVIIRLEELKKKRSSEA